jgi:pilus assembly protein CpaC
MNRLLLAAGVACSLFAPQVRADIVDDVVQLRVGRAEHVTSEWPVKGVALTDPVVADVQMLTPLLVAVAGKQPGITDLLIWGEGEQTRTLRVEVTQDMSTMVADLQTLLPGAEIELTGRGATILVTGRLARAEQAPMLHAYFEGREIDWVDGSSVAGGQQVSCQVRLAEVSRNGLRQLGLNILKSGESFFGGSVPGPSSGGPVQPISMGALAGDTALGNTPFSFTSTVGVSPGVTLFAGFPKADLMYFLQALRENEYMRILAEPNLVAMSGEEARFLAGGEFPIPVVQGGGTSGGTSVTIEYKEFGISLRFKPLVLGDGKIRLRIFSEVSDLSEIGAVEIQGFSVPGIITRNAETTVELHSGQTFALAGLLSSRTQGRVSSIPGLGDLPILGPLFSSSRYSTSETELVLLCTTTLVEPLSVGEVPTLPGEDHVEPSDWEFFFMGKLESDASDAQPVGPAADWMMKAGLAGLIGPGGWARHGQGAVASRARPSELQPALPAWTEAVGAEEASIP